MKTGKPGSSIIVRKENEKMQTRKRLVSESGIEARARLLNEYDEKYFNLWLNSYQWKGISRDQREYIMRKFWENGTVASFPIIEPDKKFMGVDAESFSDGLIGFATYAPQMFNMYNFPTEVILINERGVPYIPSTPQKNNIDVVLGYALHSRSPLRPIVMSMINRILDVEMTIRTNLKALKTPIVIEVTPDSEQHAEELEAHVEEDDSLFFVNVKELSALNGMNTGAPFYVDRLYSYKKSLENELLTFLGIDNIGQAKAERMITDEANSNNDLINDFSDCIKDNLKEFCKMTNETLGFNINCEQTSAPVVSESEALKSKSVERTDENVTDDK